MLTQIDSKLADLIQKEKKRQLKQIRLIPSENYVSFAVQEAVGSPLMNKYSEGQVGKRYYQGNTYIDQIESLVKERALKAFDLNPDEWGVNVQAVNGSLANLAVYWALLKPGDKLLSMFLYDGGHLSHGWKLPEENRPVSFTAKIFQPSYYCVDPKSRVFDYEVVEERALEERPAMIISGGTAYPREIDHKRMREIADKVGAYYLADIAHEAGLVLAGVNKSPFPYAHVVTMTSRKTLRGPIGALIFSRQQYSEVIDRAVFPGLQGGPMNHSIAGIGVALHEASRPEFKEYARQVVVNAKRLAAELIKYGFDVTSGGTDKHLILVDLRNRGLTGAQLALALETANIIVNKNTVPGETGKPWNPSGIRLGTPAVTSRGMKEAEMEKIAEWISQVALNLKGLESCKLSRFKQVIQADQSLTAIAIEVKKLASRFLAPGIGFTRDCPL